MSFLTPLYLLGGLAVLAPILFHLIRRTTQGARPFSSLLFLEPSPPRITRRSRIDNWVLLALRALALLVLALAFARPFLRQSTAQPLATSVQKRVALVIDRSASMRREGLWKQAQAEALRVIDACRPGDQLAVLAFDSNTQPLLSFQEAENLDPAQQAALARGLVERLEPSWGPSHTGQALVDATGAIETAGDRGPEATQLDRSIILISDLQQGSILTPLSELEWPSDVTLEVRLVAAHEPNAGLHWLTEADPDSAAATPDATEPRIRVLNEPGSTLDTFTLEWDDRTSPVIPVSVAPAASRIVRAAVPANPALGRELTLHGDKVPFDNRLFLAPATRGERTVVYLGADTGGDSSGLAYYLERALASRPARPVKLERPPAAGKLEIKADPSLPLVVVATNLPAENLAAIQTYMNEGGTVLAVVSSVDFAPTLRALVDNQGLALDEAPRRRDTMLGEIAFDHPVFSPFAAPQFNDFTRIKFWKYRKLDPADLPDARVIARFETGDPALIEKRVGKGRLDVLTSGWNPDDSQLARSSKFMPIVWSLLEPATESSGMARQVFVGEPVRLPVQAMRVQKPSGDWESVAGQSEPYRGCDVPGLYTVDTPSGPVVFAVNLDPAESRTAAQGPEVLAQLGCRMAASSVHVEASRAEERQMRNAELEARQKVWRPLIIGAILILIAETWLAGWLNRRRALPAEVSPG